MDLDVAVECELPAREELVKGAEERKRRERGRVTGLFSVWD